jgi:hypothetical protein
LQEDKEDDIPDEEKEKERPHLLIDLNRQKKTNSCSVADPVVSGPFWSDPDRDGWDQIRILALINDSI